MERKIAVLHHDDADGFGAAFAAWCGLSLFVPPDQNRPEMRFIEVNYPNETMPKAVLDELLDFAPTEVFIVDFSYKRDALEALKRFFPALMVIDHHKTAKEDLEGLDFCIFDMEKSGCALTWELLCRDEEGIVRPMPAILGYVQDRDLWKWELPKTREINAYIATLPKDFHAWLNFSGHDAVLAGGAVLAFQRAQMEQRVKEAKLIPTFTHDGCLRFGVPGEHLLTMSYTEPSPSVPFVNATENVSELADLLADAYPDAPFVVMYSDRADGMRAYSLRSRNGFDVSAIARSFGGGGHAPAAGFTLAAPGII